MSLKIIGSFVGVMLMLALGCESTYDAQDENGTDESSGNGSDGQGGGGTAADAIPLSGVVWLDANVSGWSQTATLNASVSGGTLQLNYDKANVWPTANTRASDGGPLNGNCWVFVQVDGTWHAATFDWMRTGQTSKSVDAVRGTGGHIPRAPLNTWTPTSGESYGFMVTTPARTAERTINERSNVSMVTWP